MGAAAAGPPPSVVMMVLATKRRLGDSVARAGSACIAVQSTQTGASGAVDVAGRFYLARDYRTGLEQDRTGARNNDDASPLGRASRV